jgi:predicted ATPase/class 3 adenylate cyclase
MTNEQVERRLVAILAADVFGYSRLMGENEDATVRDIKGHQAVLLPLIGHYGGRIIDTAGDGILAEFPSALRAVECAVEIQTVMATRNAGVPEHRRMLFRIGINLGDVIHDETRIYGDGVNIAARLEAIAPPSGICVSGIVHDAVRNKIEIAFEDTGEQQLKNIAHPVRVYRVGFGEHIEVQQPTSHHNLPAELTTFIGRTKEIAEIKQLLTSTRLVSLTGTGGVGKTRLAIKVAAEMLGDFQHGAWLVELAGLSDPILVPQAVVSALGVIEQRNSSLTDTLTQHLRSKSMLLLLDNCEHVLNACSELATALLQASPSLRILTTTRENLGIAGEIIFRVPPLSVPNAATVITPDLLMEYESSRLFIERASCVNLGFTVTSDNASEIVQICSRLDGLPLAIELAAARTNVLSVSQICNRLDDQFRLLTGRNRAVLGRHQTLRAVIDWSYQLLSELERAVLRRLSVFVGGWSLDAAEVICSGSGVESFEILDLVAQLVDKSLVVAYTQSREARFLLLETVRQYSQLRLVEAEEAQMVRDRHLDYFSALAHQAEGSLEAGDGMDWSERLERENDNIRAALQWSFSGGNAETGLKLASALTYFWRTRGYVSEGIRWFENILLIKPDDISISRARAYFGIGWLVWWRGDSVRATELTEKALKIFRSVEDKWGIARSLQEIGFHSYARGEYARTVVLAEESLTLARELNDNYLIGYSLFLKATVAERMGNDTEAATLYRECLAVRRHVGHKFGMASAMRGLGRISLRQANWEDTAQYYRGSLTLAYEQKDVSAVAPSLEGLAALAVAQAMPERAARLLGAAEVQREAIGVPPLAFERDSYENTVADLNGVLDDEAFRMLRLEGREMSLERAVAYALGLKS